MLPRVAHIIYVSLHIFSFNVVLCCESIFSSQPIGMLFSQWRVVDIYLCAIVYLFLLYQVNFCCIYVVMGNVLCSEWIDHAFFCCVLLKWKLTKLQNQVIWNENWQNWLYAIKHPRGLDNGFSLFFCSQKHVSEI